LSATLCSFRFERDLLWPDESVSTTNTDLIAIEGMKIDICKMKTAK